MLLAALEYLCKGHHVSLIAYFWHAHFVKGGKDHSLILHDSNKFRHLDHEHNLKKDNGCSLKIHAGSNRKEQAAKSKIHT